RHLMLFFFRKGKNASQAIKEICALYGNDSVSERTIRKWFAKFRAGDCSLIDKERSGRPFTTDDDQIKSLIENNPHSTTRELVESLNLSKSAVREHLVKLGFTNRYDVLVPHEL
ncbi:HTH ArsR-type DNA-binding domain, partial [Trinorchestia longiramus]